MSNIRDVAKRAGVSVATVSRFLNRNGYVKKSTAEKVQKVIDELNYRPNAIAVGLNNKSMPTLGLIVPDITNPFFSSLAKEIEIAARKHGYTVILCNSDGELETELEHLKVLKSKYVAGIILASNTFDNSSYQGLDIPIVLVDRKITGNLYSMITSNNLRGGQLATDHLLHIGCKKIAHIAGPSTTLTGQQRLKGYKDTIGSKSWFSDKLVTQINYNVEEAKRATLNLLKEDDSIDGIFAGNDLIAIGCIKAIHSLGLSIPGDIAVIGFDNISVSELIIPELSTIAQPIMEMSAKAVEVILHTLKNKEDPPVFHQFEVKLIQRASTSIKKVDH